MIYIKPLATIVALTALLAACAPNATEPPGDNAAGAAQEDAGALWSADTRTILTGEAARALANQCSRVSPGPVEDVWTPGEAEIEALENELVLLLARELEGAGQSASPGDYYRQYAGFVIAGRRIIYVNGMDETAVERDPNPTRSFDWRTQPVIICDGGSITFGVEYDPATRHFSNFAFNGSV